MRPNISPIVIVLLSLASSLVGCWPAGKIDPNLIYKYQQYALKNSPQPRQGELLPVAGTTGEPLKTYTGKDGQIYIELSLKEAVHRAMANNVEIKVISFDPAIAREQWVEAAAAFDTLLFASGRHSQSNSTDTPTALNQVTRTITGEGGIRQPLITGGSVDVFYDAARSVTPVPATILTPASIDTSYTQRMGVRLTQPLLRNGGLEVNLAEIRIAKLNYKQTLSQFTSKVLDIISQVQTQYWQLVQARRELEIQQRLLDRTIETYTQVKDRFELDASAVQITQALAAVESRRALLIRARKNILDVQDQLIRTMSDSSMTLLGDVMILPTTPPSELHIEMDRADQVATALRFNPEMEQARLAIAISDITVRVAKHQTLPKLDFTGGVSAAGVSPTFGQAGTEMTSFDFIDYNLGLAFEYPLANRAANATLARTRYERLKNITNLQNVADQVAVAINEAVRQIETSYLETQAQRAAAEANRANLEAIENRQKYRAALTPEFLQLKLQAQESLAIAESAANAASVNFNIAQATLQRVAGTSIESSGVNISDVNGNIVQVMTDRIKLPATGDAGSRPSTVPVTAPESEPSANDLNSLE